MKRLYEDAGVMTLGLIALAAFLLVAALATAMGRDVGIDEEEIPFSSPANGDDEAVDAILPDAHVRTGFLPADVRESSGIAHSQRDERVWWTHNDGNDGRVFAVLDDGTLLGTWRLTGVEIEDVEDIAAASCPDRTNEPCLYLADTGDNNRRRDEYRIVVVREPALASDRQQAGGTLELVKALRFRYGDESYDAEALGVLADAIIVITKGQSGAAEVFRLPLRGGERVTGGELITAEALGELPVDVDRKANRITAAAVSPSGDRMAVRSDKDVTLFELPGLREITRCDFDDVGQQGEAVDFIDDTTLILTFEAGGNGRAPIVRVKCGDTRAGRPQ